MFCHGNVRYAHYTDCPLYVGYAKLALELFANEEVMPFTAMKELAEKCHERCGVGRLS